MRCRRDGKRDPERYEHEDYPEPGVRSIEAKPQTEDWATNTCRHRQFFVRPWTRRWNRGRNKPAGEIAITTWICGNIDLTASRTSERGCQLEVESGSVRAYE